jgi:hypothetical protein
MACLRRTACLLGIFTLPIALAAQKPVVRPPATEALALFLDCHVQGCDDAYLRTEITWVNYVRDRTAAQVYVIATGVQTGSGGSRVTLAFRGRKALAEVNDAFDYDIPQGATSDDARRLLVHALQLGLAHYAMHTRYGKDIAVTYTGVADTSTALGAHDPWDFWVFNVAASGGLNGQSQSSSRGASGSFSASRVTAAWKIEGGLSGSNNHDRYVLDDTTTLIARSNSYHGNALVVRSVDAHLSLGGTISTSSSTQDNIDHSYRVAPAAEYDFLRYDQYSRRRLVMSYTLGVNNFSYIDTTVYNRLHESRLDHELSLSYATTQPWGNANASLSGSSYLSNFSQNRLSFYTSLSVRVLRGLQVGYSFSYSRVRDQLSLERGDASDADILLQLRQLATSYEYSGRFSLSYTFGSLFNNVVNPRMD